MGRSVILTLYLVLIPVLLPFAAFSTRSSASQLPECCRRDGRHHCAMKAGMADSAATPTLRSEPTACPHQSSLKFVTTLTSCPAPAAAIYAGVTAHPAGYVQVAVQRIVSESRSHHKRGPPSLTSC